MIVTRFALDTGRRETAADGVVFQGLPYTITNAHFGPTRRLHPSDCKLATINPSSLPRADDGGYLG